MALQHDINQLELWSSNSLLQFKPAKCKVLTVTRKQNPCLFPCRIYDNLLVRTNTESDLGIIVTKDLKWDAHVAKIVSKANKILGLLKRTCFKLTNQEVRKTLYLPLVKSQLTYGTEVGSPHTGDLMKKIEGVQRRATLWITRTKRGELTYVQRLNKLDLLPLCYEREIRDLTFYIKCKRNLVDLDIGNFTSVLESRTRQGCSLLFLRTPFCKTSTFKASYFNRLVKTWNAAVKILPDLPVYPLPKFKSQIRHVYSQLLCETFSPDFACTFFVMSIMFLSSVVSSCRV